MDNNNGNKNSDMRETFWERLTSPIVWVAVLTAVYTYVEVSDFSDPKHIALAIIGTLIAAFSALNNPADKKKV